jgi:hypothetical protein
LDSILYLGPGSHRTPDDPDKYGERGGTPGTLPHGTWQFFRNVGEIITGIRQDGSVIPRDRYGRGVNEQRGETGLHPLTVGDDMSGSGQMNGGIATPMTS